MKNWHLIEQQPLLSGIYKKPPLVSYKRGVFLKRRPKNEDLRTHGLKRRPHGLKRRPYGLKRRPRGLKGRPHGLKRRPYALKRRPHGLKGRPYGLKRKTPWTKTTDAIP